MCAGVQSHFYQKFENEQEGRQKALHDMTKRDQMLELMQTGEWVLEVSLKHSGSLGHFDGEVMWGKNNTDSEYTSAFENQLFDCFRRAYPLGPEGTAAAVEKFRRFCETLREQPNLRWMQAIDVEQALCEYSKYERYRTDGITAAKRYQPRVEEV